ncbi:MAG: aspartate aminotransferase family protein [Pedobacter sp.]|nr:aspartate aminotransferase family protein [Pedobacter sp.]MDQ8054224.1 aspartate aminotransferase family protein [Pedobacter sp.]
MLTQRQLFLQYNAQTSSTPLLLEFVRAKGLYMYDANGRAYMDLIAGIGVSNVGHCNDAVVSAVKEQAETFMHLMVYGEFVQSPQTNFAHALSKVLPPELSCTYFVNSGAEAVEGAMKLAKRFTGRGEIIALKNSYHGSTQGALSLMGNETYKQAYRPLLPSIRFIELNDEAGLSAITERTAAVFIETIQGEAGVRLPSPSYLRLLREKCNETGTLLIFDEIQCGFGRTGKLFGFEHYHITPDVLLLAKGIGGGMPIGAFVASPKLMSVFTENPILGHITTFGGHPVSCAAGLATLNEILSNKLVDDVLSKGELFKSLLKHPAIKEIRGIGLLLAVEFESYEVNKKIIDGCIADGLITDWFLHCSHSMRIAPPLIITDAEIRRACGIILNNIDKFAP